MATDYWKTCWSLEVPFFTSMKWQDQFEQIFWLLHARGTIDKVKSLIDILIPNFQSSYKPSLDIAVDETKVSFWRRFGAKQYMPNKPVMYEVKAFTMADSKNAYLLNVLPYTGSDTLQEANSQYSDLPNQRRLWYTWLSRISTRVITCLLKDFTPAFLLPRSLLTVLCHSLKHQCRIVLSFLIQFP